MRTFWGIVTKYLTFPTGHCGMRFSIGTRYNCIGFKERKFSFDAGTRTLRRLTGATRTTGSTRITTPRGVVAVGASSMVSGRSVDYLIFEQFAHSILHTNWVPEETVNEVAPERFLVFIVSGVSVLNKQKTQIHIPCCYVN